MLHVAVDIQRTFLLELRMSLHVQATFLATAGGIGQGVRCPFHHFYIDALAVLYVDGCPRADGSAVGQRQSVQFQCCLIRARHVKLSVCRGSRQLVSDLLCQVGALLDVHMGAAHRRRDILGHISGYCYRCRCSTIDDSHLIVGDRSVVDIHLGDITKGGSLVQNGQRRTVGIGHLTGLLGRKLIGHTTHHHIQCLCLYCYRQQQTYYQRNNLFHFTTTLMVLLLLFNT